MMTRRLAVAALAAAAIALEAAFLHLAVAAPLASALGDFEANARPAAAETAETTVTAEAPSAPVAAKRS